MPNPLELFGRVENRKMEIHNLSGTNLTVNGKFIRANEQWKFPLLQQDTTNINVNVAGSTYNYTVDGDKTHVGLVAYPGGVEFYEEIVPSAYYFTGLQLGLVLGIFGFILMMFRNLGRTSPEL